MGRRLNQRDVMKFLNSKVVSSKITAILLNRVVLKSMKTSKLLYSMYFDVNMRGNDI